MPKKQSGKFQRGRRPHNAKILEFSSLEELIRTLGAESKKVSVNGTEVEMTWAERSLRLTIDRALKGNVRDLAALLRLMARHPQVTGRGRTRNVSIIRGALAGV